MRWHYARNADNLDSYVRAIVVRAHIDDTRRPWFRVRLFGTVPEPRPTGVAGDVESATTLRAALSRLPAGQRAVVVLRFLCDMPVNDVADVLRCSPGTVKSQTSHGLAKLRQLLDDNDFAMTAKEN
jgi:RNA polymerase sigma factor (sigma-70 family)